LEINANTWPKQGRFHFLFPKLSLSKIDEDVSFEAVRSDFFLFKEDLCCLHLLNKVFIMHLAAASDQSWNKAIRRFIFIYV